MRLQQGRGGCYFQLTGCPFEHLRTVWKIAALGAEAEGDFANMRLSFGKRVL